MAEVVDSIIAELIVRQQQYVAGFNEATAAHDRFTKSIPKIGALGGISESDAKQYADRHKNAANDVAVGEEQATARVVRTRKARADAVKQADATEVASAKASASARVETEEQAQARLSAVVDRAEARRRAALSPAASSRIGSTVPREATGQRPISGGGLGGDASIAEQAEVNRIAAEIATIQAGKTTLVGQEKRDTAEILAQLRLEKQLLAANVGEEEILLRLESLRTAQAAKRVLEEKATSGAGGAKNAEQFARGAGFFQATGGAFAIGGIAAAAGVAGIVEATKAGLAYSLTLKEVSDQLGISTKALQIFQSAGESAGVKTEQLRETLGQVSSNLGKAQEGSETQIKLFAALGINIGNSRDGYKSLGDVLPTIADRLSKVSSQTQRNALETALGGEQLRKLDPILKQGSAGLDQLGDSLEREGAILSSGEIAHAAKVAADLKRVGDQLERQLAGVVSQNADAILGLARAFGTLASEALKAIGSVQRFSAVQLANGRGLFQSPEREKFGRDFLNQSGEGRAQNRQRIAGVRDELNAFEASDARSRSISGLGTVENTPEGIRAARAKLTAQRNEIRGAANADRVADVATQTGNPDQSAIDKLFAPKGPKGRKGKSADTLANEADQRTRAFNDAIARYYDEQQAAVAEQTSDESKRRDLQREQLERDSERVIADLKLKAGEDIRKGADEALTNARLAQVIAAERAAVAEKQQAINLEELLSSLKRNNAKADDILNFADRQLQAQEQLATTIDERRAIEKKLLENARERERNDAQLVLDRATQGDPSISKADVDQANRTIKRLPEQAARDNASVDQQNQHPLDAYLTRLHQATDSTKDAIQNVEVAGLQRLEDQLSSTLVKTLGLKGAFGDLFGSILADLAKIEIEKGLLGILGGGKTTVGGAQSFGGLAGLLAQGNGVGGSGGGGILKTIGSAIGSIFSHRATGGPVVPGANYLVGERGPEVVNFGSAGNVYPNGALPNVRGGGGTTIVQQTIHVDGRNSVTPGDFAQQIVAQAAEHANRVASLAGQAAVNAAPAAVRRVQTLGS